MLDTLKKILDRILEFWNKFTSKQKTLIISIVAVVVFTLALLVVLLSQKNYVEIVTFENNADTAAAKDVLVENNIDYEVTDDGLTIKVIEKQQAEARMALGQNNIAATPTNTTGDLFNSSMSTTDRERQLKHKIYLENQIIADIRALEGVSRASVRIDLPNENTSIFKEEKIPSASIALTLSQELSDESVQGIAAYVATALGTSGNTNSIRIIDQSGKLLFDGSADTGTVSGKAALEQKIRNDVKGSFENDVRDLLLSGGRYDDVEVAANLAINLDQVAIEDELKYTENPEGNVGPMDSKYLYEAENIDGTQGVPGTDSNDGTTDYQIPDGGVGNSTAKVIKEEYSTSIRKTNTTKEVGKVDYPQSSAGIILNKYVIYDEAAMKKQGLLRGTNFEQFQADNSEATPIEVEEDMYNAVSMATGIPVDSLQILAYNIPVFYPQTSSGAMTVTNYLQFILAVLIVALLIFVVFKGMKPVEVTELEPELSIEALLATTKENQTLEDIEFKDKSVTRQQIERFVDENPEQVALLLRNWLNDEWE